MLADVLDFTAVGTNVQDIDGNVDYRFREVGGPIHSYSVGRYFNRVRLDGSMVDFLADRGVVPTIGDTWVVSVVKRNDDLTTELVTWPPADLRIYDFMRSSMQLFLNVLHPARIYFTATRQDINPVTYPWGFTYAPA